MDIKRPLLVVIVTFFFSIFLMLGMLIKVQSNSEIPELGKDFTAVFQTLDQNYVDPINRKNLFIQVVSELVNRDHYSGYLEEESFAKFEENIEGNYVGIGAEFDRKVDHLLITNIIPFSSASGVLKFDDRIYRINKQDVENLDNSQIATLIRGPENSELTLEIRRGSDENLLPIVLKRKKVEKSAIRFVFLIDSEKGIGYINIEIFNNNLAENFRREYAKLLNETPKMKSLILDLRGNPGGGLYSAVDFCDLFLKSGLIVATVGNEKGTGSLDEKFNATINGELPLVPLLILLDRDSASASELSAGCLQDFKIAKIFGEKSYGKGEAQTSFPMHSRVIGDYGIKLTTSRFYTNSGFEKKPKVSISGKGIIPDYPYDYGFQDQYLARFKRLNRAWGIWNQELAEHHSVMETKTNSTYFSNLEKTDPGLKMAIEILSKQGEK